MQMRSRPLLLLSIASFVVMLLSAVAFLVYRNQETIFGGSAGSSQAAIYFEEAAKPQLNQPYQITVYGDSPILNINAVGFYMRYDPQKVRVSEIDTLRSFCQFYPEKKFDNQLGSLSLACGAPHPGVKGKFEIATITFIPTTIGSSSLLIDSRSSLLVSDGKGTNVLQDYPTWEISVRAEL